MTLTVDQQWVVDKTNALNNEMEGMYGPANKAWPEHGLQKVFTQVIEQMVFSEGVTVVLESLIEAVQGDAKDRENPTYNTLVVDVLQKVKAIYDPVLHD